MHKKNLPPDRILSYFQRESKVLAIITAIALVYGMRYVKRFYVRRFANNVNRRMKETLYATWSAKAAGNWNRRGPAMC